MVKSMAHEPLVVTFPMRSTFKKPLQETSTLWLCQQLAIENDPVEIVDFPIDITVIFQFVFWDS